MFKLLVLSCLLVGCLAEPFLFPSCCPGGHVPDAAGMPIPIPNEQWVTRRSIVRTEPKPSKARTVTECLKEMSTNHRDSAGVKPTRVKISLLKERLGSGGQGNVGTGLSEAGRSFRRGCADRAEGWRACARLEDSSALAPHGYDCGAFFYCAGLGRPVCRRCPAGLHFSPELQVCDWPSNVHCNPTTSYPTTTEDSSTTVTDSSTKPDEYYTTDSISTTTLEESSTFESTTSTPFEESSTFESTTSIPFEESSTFESTTSIPFEESSTFESPTSTPFEEFSTTEVIYT